MTDTDSRFRHRGDAYSVVPEQRYALDTDEFIATGRYLVVFDRLRHPVRALQRPTAFGVAYQPFQTRDHACKAAERILLEHPYLRCAADTPVDGKTLAGDGDSAATRKLDREEYISWADVQEILDRYDMDVEIAVQYLRHAPCKNQQETADAIDDVSRPTLRNKYRDGFDAMNDREFLTVAAYLLSKRYHHRFTNSSGQDAGNE